MKSIRKGVRGTIMTYMELVQLREKLITDIRADTRPTDFSSLEEFQKYITAIEEGIVMFYSRTLLHLQDLEDSDQLKKSA